MRRFAVHLLFLALGVLVWSPAARAASPSLAELHFFFQHLVNLDAAADAAEAEDPILDASEWRTLDQRAAKITDLEGTILKEIAHGCIQTLRDHDAEVKAAAAAGTEVPTQRKQIVSSAVDELRLRLGEASFEKLASYVHASFGPAIEAAVTKTEAEASVAVEASSVPAIFTIGVASRVTKLPNSSLMAECATILDDNQTRQDYVSGVSGCTVYGHLQGAQIPAVTVPCDAYGVCVGTYPSGGPGMVRWTEGIHALQMKPSQCTSETGGTFQGMLDPLRFCRPNWPFYQPSGSVYNVGGEPACWPANAYGNCIVAQTRSNAAVFIDIFPWSVTLNANQQQAFQPNLVPVAWGLSGPGTLQGNVYTAPAQILSPQTAIITACDPVTGFIDCTSATITLEPRTVKLDPAAIELLPLAEIDIDAAIDPPSEGEEFEWSISPAIGTLLPAGDSATYRAPSNEELASTTEVTVKACLSPQPATGPLCGTAKVTVPKLQFYITGSKTELELNETLQLTAFVQGSNQRRDVLWSKPQDGTISEINPADPMIALYKAPAYPVPVPIEIKACLLESPEFCATYSVTVPLPLRFTSITPDDGRWQAGTFEPFTIIGRGFGSNPQVELSDLEVQLTQVSDTVINGKVRVLVATTTMAPIVTVTYAPGRTSSVVRSPIPVEPATVSAVPPTAQLQAGGTLSLAGSCLTSTADACTSLEVPSWTASPGTITSPGLIVTYTAPATVTSSTTANISACWYHGTASRCAPAAVTLLPPAGPVVTVSPKTVSLKPGETQHFTAQVTGDPNTAVTWSANSPNGLYTAPSPFAGPATVTVTATSQADPSRKDTATVTLIPAPLSVTSTPSPASANHGTAITWTATATGGTPGTIQYALFRRKAGTTAWSPETWQASNLLTWTPGAADVGAWEIRIGARDVNTPPGGHALHDPGPVQVQAPLTITCSASTPYGNHGTAFTWTVTASGGTGTGRQYALFRRRAGTTPWTPDVSGPAWTANNVLTWTPAAADVGHWDIYIWAKDSGTPPTQNNHGYAAGCNPGPIQVLAPMTLIVTPSPAAAYSGLPITWTATATGNDPATTQFGWARHRVGSAEPWTVPVWQAGNVITWTPGAADVGVWEIAVGVKDASTPPTLNGAGYAAYYNPGQVNVVAPLTVSGTMSPASVTHGTALTWTATASGGTSVNRQYALFRRRSGTTAWTPAVSSPAWQPSNVMSWTPGAADVGLWDIFVWVKDSATPPTMNTHGYAASYNPGSVDVKAPPPLVVSCSASPAQVTAGTAINWTATASGGVPASTQFAFFRKKNGAAAWIPAVNAPAWQSSGSFNWTPPAADAGTWEFSIWVRDGNTPANANGYGYASYCNPGPTLVVAPLTLTSTPSPAAAYSGQPITWTLTSTGGVPGTVQYAWGRRIAGTATWSTPVWQASNVITWTPTAAEAGSTWEIAMVVRDSLTSPTQNGFGYAAYVNPGNVNVVTPLTVTGTTSPATATHGNQLTWTATASGGTGVNRMYAFFRKRPSDTVWTPSVTSPGWQASNVMSWTPGAGDVGTWETYVWVKDSATPPTMNTYGLAAWYNSGTVQIVAPLGLTSTPSPALATHGNAINWTVTASGGVPGSTQFALRRRVVGTTAWTPASPAWQAGNVLSWTPTSGEIATWEIAIWVRDGNTPPTMNGSGYAATVNPGTVQVVAPLVVTGTSSPGSIYHGNPITWTATGSGGTGVGRQYAVFRMKSGTSNWIPAETAPAWQTSNQMSWTPGPGDVGTWTIVVWFKDANTPSNANGYGYGAYYNAGPVQVYAHPTVSGTGSPSSVSYGTAITWTATGSGGIGSAKQYALFRKKVGTSNWIPALTSPGWQAGNVLSWTPGSADVGTWEIFVWMKDANTPPAMNTYGHAAWYNAGAVEVTGPLSLSSCTPSPVSANYNTPISWTAYASGGHAPTIQYALFRKRTGSSTWVPAQTSPAWQSGSVMSWTPGSGDVGGWDISIWIRDGNTASGYAASCSPGTVQVTAPLGLSVTGTPSSSAYGTTITWTAYASGGYPPTTRFAFFRRPSGTGNSGWIPSIYSPAWQTSNVMSWTPTSSDVGSWDIYVWVKDGSTPPTQNTYGYAAGANGGSFEVTAPIYQDSDPIGWVDGVDNEWIWGWACDPDYPWESNRVDLWTTSWQYLGSAEANGWSSTPINNACGGGSAHYFSFYHGGSIPSGTHFWVWSIDLPYGTPGGVNVPIGGSGGNEFVMP